MKKELKTTRFGGFQGRTAEETGIEVTGVVMESKIDLTGLVDTDRMIEVERIDIDWAVELCGSHRKGGHI